jgi:membrane-associated phospholipid phosphatase
MATALVLKAVGVDNAHSWPQFLVGAGVSYVLTAGVTYTLKHTIHERRPDGSDRRSMPSGHAAFAFSGATVLHKEFGHVSPWISVAGYTVATATAVDRVCRNHHYWYDVAVGAGVGVLSAELAYYLNRKLFPSRKKHVDVALSPVGLNLMVMW